MVNFRVPVPINFLRRRICCLFLRNPAARTVRVADGNSGLYIVYKHVEAYAFPVILYRPTLHFDAARNQLILIKHRRYPVQDMSLCFFYIIRHHIFKRQHPGDIQITRPGNQIFLVCIFRRQLVTDQMTTIIQKFSIDSVIFRLLPAGGLHLADALPLFGRHQILPDVCISGRTSAKAVQLAVGFKGFRRVVLFRKKRNVVV